MGYYDPDKDYSVAIEEAKSSGASQDYIDQLLEERENKIEDKYGGEEPNMWDSDKTYSEALDDDDDDSISAALDYHYSNFGGSDPWSKYAGTNYHQDAIYAAQQGNWDAVINFLNQREEKTAAQGDNRGKTSAEIYAELWDLYGNKKVPVMGGGGGFNFNTSKPSYNDNGLDGRINAMLDQILNREGFSYTAADDPLYQQYQNMYNREGTRAMNDTLASAAANAGGMNSYAITAAQQANNYYAAQLGDKIPELYQLAYEMYLQDIDNQVRDLGLLQNMDDTQYNRYRDTMSDWYNDRDFAYGQYRDDVADGQWQLGFDHQVSQDAIDNAFRQDQFDWSVATDKRDYDYTVGQDSKEWDYMVGQTEFENDMLEKEFDAMYGSGADVGSGGGSDGGSGGGSDKGSGSDSDKDDTGSFYYAGNEGIDKSTIEAMQEKIGAAVDGKWGPESQRKSGMSATEAYKAYKNGTLKAVSTGDPYADTRNNTTSTTYKGGSTGVSAKAKQIAAGLDTMRGSIGSKDAIANSLAIEIDMAGDSLSDADARWLFSYFGYDPDEWLE